MPPFYPLLLFNTANQFTCSLNLTVASCVYILEPQWNPMVEYQAIARVLRLGQKRNVRVVRYIMKDTVEGVSYLDLSSSSSYCKTKLTESCSLSYSHNN